MDQFHFSTDFEKSSCGSLSRVLVLEGPTVQAHVTRTELHVWPSVGMRSRG